MRKLLLVAGLAAAALIPSIASAQQTCEDQRGNQVAGTVVGAGIGALLGSAIAGRGSHTEGAVIGGVGGAVIGNQVSAPSRDCSHAYGYYDRNSQWHANAVARSDAQGYYDRNGAWVNGAPNGYYDGSGAWVAARSNGSAAGYTDSHGRWVPASANGYYDDRGSWVVTTTGHYDSSGRWVRSQDAGAYDAYGRWTPGASSGHRDANGVWIADAQPGYYDSGRHWHAGSAWGYYDADGLWVSTASAYSSPTSYGDQPRTGMRRDIDSRLARAEQRIRTGADSGTLARSDARQDLGELNSIRRQESDLRREDGRLSESDDAMLQARLDRLNDRVRQSLGADAGY